METLYTVSEAAHALNFAKYTLRKWIRDGKVEAVRFGENGHYRITQSELDKLAKGELK